MKKKVIILVSSLITVLLIFGAYFLFKNQTIRQETEALKQLKILNAMSNSNIFILNNTAHLYSSLKEENSDTLSANIKKVHADANQIFFMIEEIKQELIQTSNDSLTLENLLNYEVVNAVMINEKNGAFKGKAYAIQDLMNKFVNQLNLKSSGNDLYESITSEPKNDVEFQSLTINEEISSIDLNFFYFDKTNVVSALCILSALEAKILLYENDYLIRILKTR